MATSTTIPPYTPATTTGGSSTTGTAGTASSTASGPEPSSVLPGETGTGTADLPTEPIKTTESASPTALPPEIASQPLVGGTANVGQTPGTPPKQLDEKQLVQEIASSLKITPKKGQPLEQAVVAELAKKYGVKIQSTYSGTGNKQGELGSLRHDIASWFDDAHRDAARATVSLDGSTTAFDAGQAGTQPDTTKNPQPVESKAALQKMLVEVAKKMGATGAQPLDEIAQNQGQATTTAGQAPSGGQQQTAAENYVAFTKTAFTGTGANQKLTAVGQQWAQNLENAGYLIFNDTETASSVNPAQVQSAYIAALTTAVQNKQSLTQTLQTGANSANVANPPQSETQSFVAGVASEFGVYLTQQQINTIATKYQNVATSAGPDSVADEIKQDVVQLYDPNNPNNPAGVANTMFEDIKQAALQYQIPVTDGQISSMVSAGLATASVAYPASAATDVENKAIQQFQEQAQGLYPTLAAQIKAGNTVQNLTAPYLTVAQAVTGVPSSTMMTEQQGGGLSKWSNFLQGGTDPKSGQPTTMTLDQWKKTLMQDPQYGFQKTQGAQDMAEQLSSAILNEFGRVTTGGSQNQGLASNYNPNSALSEGNPTAGS